MVSYTDLWGINPCRFLVLVVFYDIIRVEHPKWWLAN